VKKNVADLVPKTIMALLVKESSRMAQSELVVKVYQAEDIISNTLNPKIIAKYIKNGEKYSIPEFNI
jgi:hypothetical protein